MTATGPAGFVWSDIVLTITADPTGFWTDAVIDSLLVARSQATQGTASTAEPARPAAGLMAVAGGLDQSLSGLGWVLQSSDTETWSIKGPDGVWPEVQAQLAAASGPGEKETAATVEALPHLPPEQQKKWQLATTGAGPDHCFVATAAPSGNDFLLRVALVTTGSTGSTGSTGRTGTKATSGSRLFPLDASGNSVTTTVAVHLLPGSNGQQLATALAPVVKAVRPAVYQLPT